MTDRDQPVTKESIARAAEELLSLEERNLRGGLSERERLRWAELTETLFALPPDIVEKRRFFRIQAVQDARLLGPFADVSATVLSVSGGGLFVQTPSLAPVGSDVEIEVDVPPSERTSVQFKGKVRWLSKGNAPALPAGFGVSFDSLDEQQCKAILELLRAHLLNHVRVGVEKYRFFFDCSPDPTLLVDHHNRILDCNDQGRSMLGLGKETDIYGASLPEVLEASSARALVSALEATRTQGAACRCEIDFPAQGGAPLRMDVCTANVRSSDIHLGVLIVGRDISDRVRVEQQRRDLERRLYQADKLACLGQVAAGVAHDINNPLAWLQSNLGLLAQYAPTLSELVSTATQGSGPTSLDTAELQHIHKNLQDVVSESLEGARRIRDIIRDLRTFSRVDVSQEEDVDVNNALEVTLRIVRNQIRQRAHVVRELSDVPLTYTNFGKVSQVLLNLVTNALRCFRIADVKANTITVRTSVEGHFLKIVIEDNGPGIPEELRERIFEPFFTFGSEGGTGLGLPIARDAVRAIGGEIHLQSEVGKGTAFSVLIPIRARPSKPPSSPPRHLSVTRRPQLLVVDDEVVILRSFERFLRRRFAVKTAASAQEALRQLEVASFDAILCDVMMPDSTGLWLYEQASLLNPALRPRFIFMTGGTFDDAARARLAQMPNPIVEKPIDMKQLEEMLLQFVASAGEGG